VLSQQTYGCKEHQMKTEDIKNMALAWAKVQEGAAEEAAKPVEEGKIPPALQAYMDKKNGKKSDDKEDDGEKKKGKMDAVGKEDGDIDNDGDKDDTDSYLANRRKAIKKNMKKESVEVDEAATATQKPNNGQAMDQGLSPNAKKEMANKTPMPDMVDAPAVNKKSFDAMRKSGKTAPKRSADNAAGDKAIKPSATPVKTEVKTEAFEPHMMYDPKTGKGYKADKEADHLRMKKMGYSHDKPKTEAVQVDELSKKTMGSYIKRATSDNAVNNMAKGMAITTNDKKMGDQATKLARKRKAGIATAADKLSASYKY